MKFLQKDLPKTPDPVSKVPTSPRKNKRAKTSPESHSASSLSNISSKHRDKRPPVEEARSRTLMKSPWSELEVDVKALKKDDYQKLETVAEEGVLFSEKEVKELRKSGSRSSRDSRLRTSEVIVNQSNRESDDTSGVDEREELAKQQSEQSEQSEQFHLSDLDEELLEWQEIQEKSTRTFIREPQEEPVQPHLEKFLQKKLLEKKRKKHCDFLRRKIRLLDKRYRSKRVQKFRSIKKDSSGLMVIPSIEIKYWLVTNSKKNNSSSDQSANYKNLTKKLRSKVLTDTDFSCQKSSHFINSLLILNTFAKENRVFTDDAVSRNGTLMSQDSRLSSQDTSWMLKVMYGILVSMSLAVMFLAKAWASYQSPCVWDYYLSFLPFVHQRRDYIHLFFDEFFKVMKNFFNCTGM